MMKEVFLSNLVSLTLAVTVMDQNQFDKSVTFYVHPPHKKAFIIPGDSDAGTIVEGGCPTQEPWMIFVHGWTESCYTTEWIPDYVGHMRKARGGCIICLDYWRYSRNNIYFKLIPHFPNLVTTLVGLMNKMNATGFSFDNGYLYGFSFGGQAVLSAAASIGTHVIPQIDVCDKAGPGFHAKKLPDPKKAAKNVCCVHTSSLYGQQIRNCHQNWSLGMCGKSQPAATKAPKGDHGMCPYFWNYSFNTTFLAIPNPFPTRCHALAPAANWPVGYKLGYDPAKNSSIRGEFYANTSAKPPYNT